MIKIIKLARELRDMPLVMGRYFDRPKCKPWDIVKGRRMACCHGLGKHERWCLEDVTSIAIPQMGRITANSLT